MEIKLYLGMARKWAWLLVLGLVLGAAGGFVFSSTQTPTYQASTRILVMRAPQEKNSDYTYLTDQQLVQNYIQILTTSAVMGEASAELGFEVSSKQVKVQQISNTQAIQLTVEDESPQRASDIANILVEVLIDQNEVLLAGRYALTEESIQAQITQIESQIAQLGIEIENISTETVQEQLKQVEAQIAAMQFEVTQLKNDIESLTPARTTDQQFLLTEKEARLNQLEPVLALYQQIYSDLIVLGKPVSSGDGTNRLAQLQSTLDLYQQIYINLLNNLETIRLARLQNTPNLVQIEPAAVPSEPVRPQPLKTTGLSAVVGLMLAGGIAFLIEYIDDTIRTPEDVERVLKLPVIGYAGSISPAHGENAETHVLKHPRSPTSEAFRSLRTNLDYSNVDKPMSKVLVSSAGPSEGKTTVAVNLAIIMAQGGKRVLLIDADMRRPRIHAIFGLSNRAGLSTLFRGKMPLRSAVQRVEGLPNLYIVPSGSLPPNPNELLASARMEAILEEAGREADIIILDSPPALVADYLVLATRVDGVLLVLQPGHTRADAAFAMLEQLERAGARALGVVLNKIPRNSYYYGGYHHYDPNKYGGYYSQQKETPKPPQPPARIPVQAGEMAARTHRPSRTVDRAIPPVERPQPEAPAQPGATRMAPPNSSAENLERFYKPRPPAVADAAARPANPANENRSSENVEYVIADYDLECWYDAR
ncbi:MAG: polysaccharide biosynthesis tyrosine autokinase [Chloroflexota bacterium]